RHRDGDGGGPRRRRPGRGRAGRGKRRGRGRRRGGGELTPVPGGGREGALVFQPCPIGGGGRVMPNRIWLPAMVTWRGTEDGFVTRDVHDVYLRYALGGPGMIVLEATGIRDVASGPLLRLGHDRFVPGLAALVAEMRAAGPALVMPQVIDFLK